MPITTVRYEKVSKVFRQRNAHAADGSLWALKDITFECAEGEVVGLLGRNGCGKSTLLKLAARVTSPTTGTVTCVRPVAPMLELGAGFHPDLTGRDNIRLNGCLLGLGANMKKSLLDEIVAFAELEQHLDTPVKRYSSGMYARLGFAVAVHSPARVLLVDEVLSVGDQLFKQKCLARMHYLRDRGTTILLVSHDMWWFRNFCTRALVLDQGHLLADTEPDEAIQSYQWLLKGLATSSSGASIATVEIAALTGNAMQIRTSYQSTGPSILVVRIKREDGVYCATCTCAIPAGTNEGNAVIDVADLYLLPGSYKVEVSIEDSATLAPMATQVSPAFTVEGELDSKRGYDGVIKLRHQWSFD
jgi:ABC-type polysaccharide/polyol phosphate transport system ATPase subunit